MIDFRDLRRPIVAAPMAGGISTPQLVAALHDAGGLGFLAAGYRSVDDLVGQIHDVRRRGADVFGVNLFVPDREPVDLDSVLAYRHRLEPLAQRFGAALPMPYDDDDGWDAKIAALLDDPVPIVSFTFGCPSADLVRRFHEVDTLLLGTVTCLDDARQVADRGLDAVIVQGPGAGGHRATFHAGTAPPQDGLWELVHQIRQAIPDLPLLAAGGIATAAEIRRFLQDADAVAIGTALLDSDEAGTHPAYRMALRDNGNRETTVTRAFSGRPARGLRNAFIDEFDEAAPAAYPMVNQLTAPIRRAAAAANRPEYLSLWAGTGWRHGRRGPAAAIVEELSVELG